MYTTSTTAAAPPSSPPVSSTSPELIIASPPPPPPALSLSPPNDLVPPRRVTSKSSLRSLRSLGSSTYEDDIDDTLDPAAAADKSLIRPSILRRLSPGLAARVKLLDGSNKTAALSRNAPGAVGRIPEEQLKVLDKQHQDLSIKVERKGRAWHGLQLSLRERKQHPGSDHLEGLDQDFHPEELFSDSEQGAPALEPAATLPEADPSLDSLEPLEPEEPSPTMSAVEASPVSTVLPPVMESNTQEQTDFEQYVQHTRDNEAKRDTEAMPPPPPPKDEPRPTSSASASMSSFFNPKQRPGSIYSFSSFSRVPFLKQVQQLTSIPLPPPSSIETSVAGISNAPGAVQAVMGAGEQVQRWIKKAEHVLGGLDVDDEVNWAASGGREGIEEIDKAIAKFDGLINVYVKIIEGVQMREDIASVNPENLETIVTQMDAVLKSWTTIKAKLRVVKGHVELAMEWEELWDSVFGDVETEVDELTQQLYQLEEKRHQVMSQPESEQEPGAQSLDISELETIVEETPAHGTMSSHKRLSMGSIFGVAATSDTPAIQTPHDDSYHADLIAIFARLQPLRASLDFLPMRLSMFQARAAKVYPTACQELDERRGQLEQGFKSLEQDAESLRKEFSEDRWILVFRNAGNQAQKMFESVERSIVKLQDGIETGSHVNNPASMAKRVESYEAKKQHYLPAIERVVSIVQKGINDRLTVNGETVTLLSNMKNKVDALKASIRVMDSSLDEYHIPPSHQLRDSISTILTMDSPATASVPDTPGSSPASSVIMTPGNAMKGSCTPLGGSSRRGSSVSSAARSTLSKVRRFSGLAQPPAALTGKKSAIPKLVAPSPSKMNTAASPTPAARKIPRPAPAPAVKDNRPRWNSSTNLNDLEVGHVYRSAPSPSPFQRSLGRASRPASTVPGLSVRDMSASPAPSTGRSLSRLSSRLTSRSPGRTGSPTPSRGILDPPPYSKLRRADGQENFPSTPRNRQSFAAPASFSRSVSQDHGRGLFSPTKSTRPGTALGHSGSRRISLLPMPKPRSGRDSAAGNRSKLSERPPWR